MASKLAPIPCPDCGGKMWDNSDTKRSPRAPDYSCKDKQNCGKGVWLKDSEKAALQGATAASNGSVPHVGRPPVVLDKMMRACLKAAQSIGDELFKDGEVVGLDAALTLNMATSLFIARTRNDGILEVEKKALADLAAKAEAERKRIEAERLAAEERARATPPQQWSPLPGAPLIPDDSDLPF